MGRAVREMDSAIVQLASTIEPLDEAAMVAARARLDRLTKPPGSLGRLEALAVLVAGITGDAAATVRPARIVVAAADHGIARRGVSAWPQEVTGQMVRTYLDGGAAINALAGWAGAGITVVDAGLAAAPPAGRGARADFLDSPVRRGGTDDMAAGPAMTRAEAIGSIQLGMRAAGDLARAGVRAIGLGEMGIGNTTSASAIASVCTGLEPELTTGFGTGLDEAGRRRKTALVAEAIARNRPDAGDPIGVLAAVGGFEIGALTGVVLAASGARIPVILDGFITAAAAVLAASLAPGVAARLIAAHRSPEPGHRVLLERLGLEPLLDLGLRLGEGSGAALGLGLLDAACRIRDEMATFAQAGVADRR